GGGFTCSATLALAVTDPTVVVASALASVLVGLRVTGRTDRRPPGSRPTAHVLRVGHGLQVSRVPAGSVPADMVKLQPVRDRADVDLVREPVGVSVPAVLVQDGPVAGSIPATGPLPALIRRTAVSGRDEVAGDHSGAPYPTEPQERFPTSGSVVIGTPMKVLDISRPISAATSCASASGA